jgi:hypothetical protein
MIGNSCNRGHIVRTEKYSSKTLESYKADVTLDLTSCNWERMELIYISAGTRFSVFGWRMKTRYEGFKPGDHETERVSVDLPRKIEHDHWVNDQLQPPTYSTHPLGILEFTINGQKVGEYSPLKVSGNNVAFSIVHNCAPSNEG